MPGVARGMPTNQPPSHHRNNTLIRHKHSPSPAERDHCKTVDRGCRFRVFGPTSRCKGLFSVDSTSDPPVSALFRGFRPGGRRAEPMRAYARAGSAVSLSILSRL